MAVGTQLWNFHDLVFSWPAQVLCCGDSVQLVRIYSLRWFCVQLAREGLASTVQPSRVWCSACEGLPFNLRGSGVQLNSQQGLQSRRASDKPHPACASQPESPHDIRWALNTEHWIPSVGHVTSHRFWETSDNRSSQFSTQHILGRQPSIYWKMNMISILMQNHVSYNCMAAVMVECRYNLLTSHRIFKHLTMELTHCPPLPTPKEKIFIFNVSCNHVQ